MSQPTFRLVHSWEEVNLPISSRTFAEVLKTHGEQLGLPKGQNSLKQLRIRGSRGLVGQDDTPVANESYYVSLSHEAKA